MDAQEAEAAPTGRFGGQPLSRLFPNIATLMALCAGLSSIRFALAEKWEMAVLFIIIAAFIDGIDGRLARLLKATSTFGAQLDSLVDFANFGVAPALILYLWKVDQIGYRGFGWACVLIYVVCCAIRLARFNTNLDDEERPVWSDKFFTGVPSPAGGFILLIPLMLSFKWPSLSIPAEWIGGYMAFVGLLLASRIPMFSGKKWTIPRRYTSLALLGAALIIAVPLVIEPWLTLSVFGGVYLLSFPWSWASYVRMQQSELEMTMSDEQE